jgi:hypothetical protein
MSLKSKLLDILRICTNLEAFDEIWNLLWLFELEDDFKWKKILNYKVIVWAWRWFQMKKDFELQSCRSRWFTTFGIKFILYIYIYIYISRVILKCTQVHSVYQMHRPCGCSFAAEPIATWQSNCNSTWTNCNLTDQLQLNANQLQLGANQLQQRD